MANIEPKKLISLIEETIERNSNVDIQKEIKNLGQVKKVKRRMDGYQYSLADHYKAMIHALLSNQRRWKDLVQLLPRIDEIFHYYESTELEEIAKDPVELEVKIRASKAGNRSIKAQMKHLSENLTTVRMYHEEFEEDFAYKSIKRIENIQEKTDQWIRKLTKESSKYKLRQMGIPLVSEYLKNVGIYTVKMDTHVLRIGGKGRLGILKSVENEKNNSKTQIMKANADFTRFAKEISEKPSYIVYLDNLIWMFGASDYGEICSEKPSCEKCLVKQNCSY